MPVSSQRRRARASISSSAGVGSSGAAEGEGVVISGELLGALVRGAAPGQLALRDAALSRGYSKAEMLHGAQDTARSGARLEPVRARAFAWLTALAVVTGFGIAVPNPASATPAVQPNNRPTPVPDA